MIHVIATIEVHPGQRQAFLDEFHKLVPQVLAEDGCIEYGPTLDVDTGLEIVAAPRADVVTVVERWESVGALRAHIEAPHVQAYLEKVKDIVASVDIRVTEPV